MKTRSTNEEQLDNLSLEGRPLHDALKSLEWINRWFGNHRSMVNSIRRIYQKEKRSLKIVDLGCGGGDLVFQVARSLQKDGQSFSITGIDGNNNALEYARQKCASFPDITFTQADILADDFVIPNCDLLISSHFIYHFEEEKLVRFIDRSLPLISTAFICSELERSGLAAWLFRIGGFFLPISKMAKEDGLLAIKRAFTKKEWVSLLSKTRAPSYELKRVPYFRIRLIIFSVNSM